MTTDLEDRFRAGVDLLDTGLPETPDLTGLRAAGRRHRRRRTALVVTAAAAVVAMGVAVPAVLAGDPGPSDAPVVNDPATSDSRAPNPTQAPDGTEIIDENDLEAALTRLALRQVVQGHLPDARPRGRGEIEWFGDTPPGNRLYHWHQVFGLNGVELDLLVRRLPPGEVPADPCQGFDPDGGDCSSTPVPEGQLVTIETEEQDGSVSRVVSLRAIDDATQVVTFVTATATGQPDGGGFSGLPTVDELAELVTDDAFRPGS